MNAKEILKLNFTPRWLRKAPASNMVYSVPIVTKRWGKLFSLVLKKSSPPLWLRLILRLVSWMFWSPDTVKWLRGKTPTFGWVLNDKEELDVGRKLGVDVLMTDYVKDSAGFGNNFGQANYA